MADDESRENKRSLQRYTLSVTADVYDRTSESFLGRLVNVHTEGLMIFGNFPFVEEKIYQLDLHVSHPEDGRKIIPVGVDCLWTRGEDDDKLHWAGCRIIDISDEAMEDLGRLIDHFGDQESGANV